MIFLRIQLNMRSGNRLLGAGLEKGKPYLLKRMQDLARTSGGPKDRRKGKILLAFPGGLRHHALMSDRHATPSQRRRHALLAQWRGVADGPLLNLPVRNAADLVGEVVAQSGLAERMRLEEVLAAWRGIVGDFLYQSSRPDSIQRGVLTVRVLQPAVHHALAVERPRILRRLQQQLKGAGIRDIRLKHG
jgi:hypothetical protein